MKNNLTPFGFFADNGSAMDTDPLHYVRNRLAADAGNLRRVAEETGITYDTVLRIRNGEGDPGYSKVRTLADYYTKLDVAAIRAATAADSIN